MIDSPMEMQANDKSNPGTPIHSSNISEPQDESVPSSISNNISNRMEQDKIDKMDNDLDVSFAEILCEGTNVSASNIGMDVGDFDVNHLGPDTMEIKLEDVFPSSLHPAIPTPPPPPPPPQPQKQAIHRGSTTNRVGLSKDLRQVIAAITDRPPQPMSPICLSNPPPPPPPPPMMI